MLQNAQNCADLTFMGSVVGERLRDAPVRVWHHHCMAMYKTARHILRSLNPASVQSDPWPLQASFSVRNT